MVWKKGYIGLSVSLILLAALFLYTEPAAAAYNCNGGGACYYCYDQYDMCSDYQSGYDKYAYNGCPIGCSECTLISEWCCKSIYYGAALYGCNTGYCGDGTCDSGEDGWNCPLYPDGSGGGDCDCKPIGRTCNYNGVFEHYANCGGKQIIDDCVDVLGPLGYCDNGECKKRNPCEGVTCNSPPSSYCSGSSVVYYDSPGTCFDGSCKYSTSSYNCPTSGCSGSTRQSGGCSGGSCYMDNVENCGSDYWGCQDGDTRAYRSQGCSGGSCYGSWSQQYSCNNNNGWVDTSGCYGSCSGTTVITVKNQEYRDYYCSSGNCDSYSKTDTRTTTCSTGENCAGRNGWYNSGGTYAACNNGQSCTAQNQEYRSYTCSNGGCTYSVTNTQTVYSGCSGCPSSGCSGDTRYYSGGCSAGSCYYGGSQDCNNNNGWQNTGSPYACCDGASTATCQDQRYADYTCSSGNCAFSSYTNSRTLRSGQASCNSPPSAYCSGSTRVYYDSTGSCSGSGCQYTQRTQNCPYGCSGGTCNNDPCSGVSCNSPPAAYCSGSTRVTYNSPGTCSDGSCSYATSNYDCPTTGCSGDTRQTGGCSSGSCYLNNAQDCNSLNTCTNSGATYQTCNNGQACTAQNRVYNDYTCSGGGCALASSAASGNCPVVYSNCQSCNSPPAESCTSNTHTWYDSGTCASGSCSYTPHTENCPYGCSGNTCSSNPCTANPCTNVPESTCSGSTLNVYSSSCTPSGGTYSCAYPATPQSCQYGCLSLPGADQCGANSPPTFSSVSVSGTFQSYVRNTHTVSVSSAGSDPNGEQVKLKCGSSTGTYNLCAGSLAPASPTCSFTNSWSDSNDHTIYCALEDSAGATSIERTVVVSADNTAPTLALTRSPSGQLTPGTSVTLTVDASDTRSGVTAINIVVDGYNARQCSAVNCVYTFTPSYGTHTYYANAYDRVGNVAWTDGSVVMPGPGPNGNGTSPPPGTIPGEGTTPLPLPAPVPGENGSPCSNNNDCRSNVCSSGTCTAAPGPLPPPSSLPVNNPPIVQPMDFTPRGNCKQGSTITLQCAASDTNQAANTLSVKGWAGTCTAGNCFATRSWTYLNNGDMTYSSGTFTKDITITAPEGTGIAATCQATDDLGGTSNWGDAYPLCTVNNCPNPPTITIDSITPNPSGAGTLSVAFTASRALYGDPAVKIKPGSQTGGTNTRAGTLRQKNGNRYTFEVPVSVNDANGISDVWVDAEFTSPNGNCQFSSSIQQVTIDTTPPVTTARCNGLPCVNMVYTAPLQLTFGCSDSTTACDSTLFSVDSPASEKYSGTRQLSADGPHTIYYLSNDSLGNRENEKSQPISVFKPPCNNPAEEPSCNPSGFVGVELYAKLSFNKTNVVTGDDAQANLYCFLRTKDITKRFIRPCDPDPTKLSIIVDKGTAKERDYFNPASGYTPPSRSAFVTPTYQKDSTYSLPTIDGTYSVTRRWDFRLPTNVFRSSVCINVTDLGSGLSVETCGDYSVTESEFLFGANFPDLSVTVPLTIDPGHAQVANFTKTMLINFTAVPSTRTFSGTSVCEPPTCRVDFSFDTTAYDKTTKWDAFRKVFAASNVIDIASNNFACDQYKTIYLQVQQAGGPSATTSKEFFVNCQTKIIATPVERRFTLGDNALDNAFTITVYNPKETPETRNFDVTATTTSTIFNMGWIGLTCTQNEQPVDGCTLGDNKVTLTVPAQGQMSFDIDVSTVARSGTFPITFVATDTEGNTYSTAVSISVFSEGLSEFAAWQLIILVIIVIGLIVYYKPDLGHKPKKRAKRK